MNDIDRVASNNGCPVTVYGETSIEEGALKQAYVAAQLPISVRAAVMPDAHFGYGICIGGVLATRNAVIPFAVGMDVACRMRLTVVDLDPSRIVGDEGRLRKAIADQTRFGVGAEFEDPRNHPVMDEDWNVSPITERNKPKAWRQLGTSGSGNHFVEFGTITFDKPDLGMKSGTYTAILSHSGSRGTGAAVATHYSRLAADLHPELPKELRALAWLDLASEDGQEYWGAMELMGKYAAASHEIIHNSLVKALKLDVMLTVENHHNFAWKENHFGQDVIVHRKGATPAGKGVLGIIPGSMATPGYLVRGKGEPLSLMSASHGAGRRMSRTQTKQSTNWNALNKMLKERGVTLISSGIDESPFGYKDIDSVMDAQKALVEIVAKFEPKLVKMAPDGERAED
jgi:tRNA-splicing ligase RtcB